MGPKRISKRLQIKAVDEAGKTSGRGKRTSIPNKNSLDQFSVEQPPVVQKRPVSRKRRRADTTEETSSETPTSVASKSPPKSPPKTPLRDPTSNAITSS